MSPFLRGVVWLLLFQCAGEVVARAAALPVPGPVLGMLGLLVALVVRGDIGEPLEAASDALSRHLSLLFVPAGVGVMQYAGRVMAEGWAIAAAIVVSTVLAIVAAAFTFQWLAARVAAADGAPAARAR